MTPHPTDFLIAHRLFSGRAFPAGPVWGAMTDGPEDRDDVIARIYEWATSDDAEKPSLATLRVWHHQDDAPARDITEDILAEAMARRWAA